MRKPHNPLIGLAELAAQGKTVKELALHFCVCDQTVKRIARLRGIVLLSNSKPGPKPKQESPRNLKILSMHRQGVNMSKIAAQMEVTRQRVQQVLKRNGISGRETNAHAAMKRAEARQAALEAHCIAKHGLTLAVYKAAVAAGHTHAYQQQRRSANSRGISWELSFADWFGIWEQSGKLQLRGRGVGRYCMSRVCDAGGYVLGNVHIQLSTENNSEFITKNRGKRNANPGVYLMYPGLSKPWMACVSKTTIGCFASEEEATAARNAFLAARPQKIKQTRTYTQKNTGNGRLGIGRGYQRSGRGFRVKVRGCYLGTYYTEADAIAARQSAVEAILASA